MNKWQIICPLAALALVSIPGIVALVRQGPSGHRYYVTAQTRMIGEELCRSTNSTRLVRMPPALRDRLSRFLGSRTGVAGVLLGDEQPPLGDGTACSRLVLSNASNIRLTVRLRQEPGPEHFYVLGFWTTE
jgi:hypothetical protein